MSKVRFIGLDVHARIIAAAVAGSSGEVRSLDVIPNRPDSIGTLAMKLESAEQLGVCDEASPSWYVMH